MNAATTSGSYSVQFIYNGGTNSYITSTGTDKQNASKTITQRMTYTPGTPASMKVKPPAAIVALGDITLGGNAVATSTDAGGVASSFGSGDIGNSTSNSSDFRVNLQDSFGNTLKDANGDAVSRLFTSEEFFMQYFGNLCPNAVLANDSSACKAEAFTTVQSRSNAFVCTTGCDDSMFTTEYTAGKRLFWITQDGIQINAQTVIGTQDDPVVIIVMNNGTLQINGGANIFGVVYVDVPYTPGTEPCSCTATDSTTTSHAVTYTKFTLSTSTTKGAIKCTTTGGCKDGGNPATTIPKNKYYLSSTGTQYNTQGTTWSTPSYTLTSGASNPAACSTAACTSSNNQCAPSNPLTYSNTQNATVTSSCSFSAWEVSGVTNTPVEIQILGIWDPHGGGNAIIQGAVLASGSVNNSTGTITYLYGSDILTKVTTDGTGSAATTTQSWSDMN
jgi:hypothetical protein